MTKLSIELDMGMARALDLTTELNVARSKMLQAEPVEKPFIL